MRATLLALLLVSCAPLRVADLPDNERLAVNAAMAGWLAAGLPSLSGCLIEYARVRHTTTAAEFEGLCWARVTAAAACAIEDSVQVGLRVHGVPVAVLRPGLAVDATGEPVVHELMHVAYSCVYGGMGDPVHADRRVWAAKGGGESAQGRARDALRARVAPAR